MKLYAVVFEESAQADVRESYEKVIQTRKVEMPPFVAQDATVT